MNNAREGKEELQEFAEFIAAYPVVPRKATDEAVCRLVKKSLRPPLWAVLAKLTVVEAAAGLATLAFCPQFDIGFGSRHGILHSLHAIPGSFLYFLSCGLFFVLFGAALGGIILRREELRVLGQGRYLYFAVYSLLAFSVFAALGAEVFLVGALAWIGGAVLGNLAGFETMTRLRKALC